MARILVIDDDDSVRRSLVLILKSGGHEVLPAASAEEGLSQFRIHDVDLAIVDIFMPEMDGFETISKLRKLSADVPILAISGGHLTSQPLLSAAFQLGAVRVLEKPFEIRSFLRIVELTLASSLQNH